MGPSSPPPLLLRDLEAPFDLEVPPRRAEAFRVPAFRAPAFFVDFRPPERDLLALRAPEDFRLALFAALFFPRALGALPAERGAGVERLAPVPTLPVRPTEAELEPNELAEVPEVLPAPKLPVEGLDVRPPAGPVLGPAAPPPVPPLPRPPPVSVDS